MIFGRFKICLYRCTGICKCKLSQMYSRTLRVIFVDSAIIGTSEKKARSFLIFAYYFSNSCQTYSKYASLIIIHTKRQQNTFDQSYMVGSQNREPLISSILRKTRITKYLLLFICFQIFQSFCVVFAVKAIAVILCFSND